jgi:hypothetical protein
VPKILGPADEFDEVEVGSDGEEIPEEEVDEENPYPNDLPPNHLSKKVPRYKFGTFAEMMTDCFTTMQTRDKDISGEIDRRLDVLREKNER